MDRWTDGCGPPIVRYIISCMIRVYDSIGILEHVCVETWKHPRSCESHGFYLLLKNTWYAAHVL